MSNLIKLVIAWMLVFPMMVTPVMAAEKDFDRNGNGKVSVREVRRELRNGQIDFAETCMDEYAKRSRNLMLKAGLVPPATAGAWAGTGLALASTVDTLAGALLFAVGWVYLVTIPAAVGLLLYEGFAIAKLVSTNKILKMLAEAREGTGKQLKKFHRRFLKKHSGHGNLSLAQFAEAVVAVDKTGAFCDGSLRGKSSYDKLRKRLAARRHLLRAVDRHLKQ